MTAQSPLHFWLNGKVVDITGVDSNQTLLDWLRERGQTGTTEGCAEGDCGACTVLLVEKNAAGEPTSRAVNSCLLLVPTLAGRQVLTVEGLGSAHGTRLHPVQAAMAKGYGSQCGYCTPGFIGSLFEAYYRSDLKVNALPDKSKICDQLSGNLCRCTGYRAIRDAAIKALGERSADRDKGNGYETLQLLENVPEAPPAVHRESAGALYSQPGTLKELLAARHQHPDATLIAGATELAVDINKKGKRFTKLISTAAVPELRKIDTTQESVTIGGAATLTEIEEALGDNEFAPLVKMLRVFASRQIRNRATLAGNLVTASPIGDMPPVLLALGAQVVLRSYEGARTLSLDDFFVGYRKTALTSDEILERVVIPRVTLPAGWRQICDSYKVSKRRELDISVVSACFNIHVDDAGVVRHCKLAYGGVAPMPARARRTEALLVGKRWTEALAEDPSVLQALGSEFTPISDVRGSAAYRGALIVDLFKKHVYDSSNHTPKESSNFEVGADDAPTDLSRSLPHDSGQAHVTGGARFVHDEASNRPMLEVWPVLSMHAHAKILRIDSAKARVMPGVALVLTAKDIPGRKSVGPVVHDEELLADSEVHYHGQVVALVAAETRSQARDAARAVVVEYEPLDAILSIEDGLAKQSFLSTPRTIKRGQVDQALASCPRQLDGELHIGGQEHFYLESQAAWAERGDADDVVVVSSTQHPTEVQETVAAVLGVAANKVVSKSPRLGGGFGGKESQAHLFAAMAALVAWKAGRPARLQLDRDVDMMTTGKRHPFLARYKIGFDDNGKLLAVKADLFSNGGYSLDLSAAILDRALLHIDNSYYVPNLEVTGRVVRTNAASNTAFRGFGGPQGMLVMEEILDRVSRELGLHPEDVREKNLYHGSGESNTTHYGQDIGDNRIVRIWSELRKSAALDARRAGLAAFNVQSRHVKRGIAITPVKFGISFTTSFLNQAGALVNVYRDGSVQVSIAGTEMGQGLYSKIAGVVMRELGLPPSHVRVMATSTEKVPNTSPTAASSGADLNGAAVKNACDILRQRLLPVAAAVLTKKLGKTVSEASVVFADGNVLVSPTECISFAQLAQAAHMSCVSLSTTGYYRTPELHFDANLGRGKPFHYFACGAAVCEVEVDGHTGMKRLLRVDILHDVGDSLNPSIDRGQVEGAFVQGQGWLTSEELVYSPSGSLSSHSASTYQIPTIGDAPGIFNVQLLSGAAQGNTIHGSKAVGEPPLMLALCVREAIRDAVAAFGGAKKQVSLRVPATHEAIHTAVRQVRG